MKFKELKTKSEKELQKLLGELRTSFRELKFKAGADQLKNIRELRTVKKNIAQVLLLLSKKHHQPAASQPAAAVKMEIKKEIN